jgi:hypothetical protein
VRVSFDHRKIGGAFAAARRRWKSPWVGLPAALAGVLFLAAIGWSVGDLGGGPRARPASGLAKPRVRVRHRPERQDLRPLPRRLPPHAGADAGFTPEPTPQPPPPPSRTHTRPRAGRHRAAVGAPAAAALPHRSGASALMAPAADRLPARGARRGHHEDTTAQTDGQDDPRPTQSPGLARSPSAGSSRRTACRFTPMLS